MRKIFEKFEHKVRENQEDEKSARFGLGKLAITSGCEFGSGAFLYNDKAKTTVKRLIDMYTNHGTRQLATKLAAEGQGKEK